jgi:hypothetical protein
MGLGRREALLAGRFRAVCMAVAALMLLAPAVGPKAASAEEPLSFRGALPPTGPPALKWGKDPFVPLLRQATGAPELRLKAILYNDTNPSAIVNDAIVYRGSAVAGQKIIDIGKTHVILQGESGTIRLEIAGVPENP